MFNKKLEPKQLLQNLRHHTFIMDECHDAKKNYMMPYLLNNITFCLFSGHMDLNLIAEEACDILTNYYDDYNIPQSPLRTAEAKAYFKESLDRTINSKIALQQMDELGLIDTLYTKAIEDLARVKEFKDLNKQQKIIGFYMNKDHMNQILNVLFNATNTPDLKDIALKAFKSLEHLSENEPKIKESLKAATDDSLIKHLNQGASLYTAFEAKKIAAGARKFLLLS